MVSSNRVTKRHTSRIMAPVVGRSWSFAAYLAGSCAALAALRGALLGLGRSDRLGGDAAARAAMLAIAGSPLITLDYVLRKGTQSNW